MGAEHFQPVFGDSDRPGERDEWVWRTYTSPLEGQRLSEGGPRPRVATLARRLLARERARSRHWATVAFLLAPRR